MVLKNLTIILSMISVLFITGCHSYKTDLEEADDLYKKRNYTAAESIYINIVKNCEDKKIINSAKEKLDGIDDLIKRKEVSDKYRMIFEKSDVKFPTYNSNYNSFELVHYKDYSVTTHYAVFANNKTKNDIIIEAFRWHNARKDENGCLVYFVTDKTYFLNKWKSENFYSYIFNSPEYRPEDKKSDAKNVIAIYCQFINFSTIFFYDKNGDVTDKIDIWL